MMDSPEANTSLIPSMSLTMGGGSHFTVYDPIIIISTQVIVPTDTSSIYVSNNC